MWPRTWTVGPLLIAVLSLEITVMPVVPDLRGADGVGDEDVGRGVEEVVLDRGGEEGGRGDHGHQRGEVVGGPRLVECLDERLGHGVAGDHQRVDPLGLDQPPDLVGVEPGHQHDLGADEALAHHRPLGGPVHEGGDRQEDQLAARGPSRTISSGSVTRVLVMGSAPPPSA